MKDPGNEFAENSAIRELIALLRDNQIRKDIKIIKSTSNNERAEA